MGGGTWLSAFKSMRGTWSSALLWQGARRRHVASAWRLSLTSRRERQGLVFSPTAIIASVCLASGSGGKLNSLSTKSSGLAQSAGLTLLQPLSASLSFFPRRQTSDYI